MLSDVSELAYELVKIPSVSGDEGEVGSFIEKRLSKHFVVEKQKVEEGRFNILARTGNPKVVLTIHMDTVPGFVPVEIRGDSLFGRGACDAKGPLAAIIVAAEDAVKQGVTDFAIYVTVGEETDFAGIKRVMQEDETYDLVVVAEPTDMRLRYGQKGLLEFMVRVNGSAAHSAFPERGISATDELLSFLQGLRLLGGEDPLLGKTTLNVATLSGGSSLNVIPDFAEAGISFRLAMGDENLLERISLSKDMKLELLANYAPYVCKDQGLLQKVGELLRKGGFFFEPVVKPGFTEMYFWSKKAPCIVVGPGDDSVEHTDGEYVSLKKLEESVPFYVSVLKEFCKP